MAVTFGAAVGSIANGLVSATSFTISPSAQVNAGVRLVMGVQTSGAASATFSATDNSTQTGTANTYVIDKSVLAQSSGNVAVFSCNVTRNILTTDTITIVTDGSATSRARSASLFTFNNVATSGQVEGSANATATTAAYDSTATTAGTSTDVAVVGMAKFASASSATPGNNGQGSTMIEIHDITGGSQTSHTEYVIDTRALAYKATGTWANSGSNWYSLVVVYKGAAAAAASPTISRRNVAAVFRAAVR